MADLHAGVAAGSYLCDVTISLHTLTQIQPDSVLTLDTPVLSNLLAFSKLNDPPAANRQQEDYTTRYISRVYIAQQLLSQATQQAAQQVRQQARQQTSNQPVSRQPPTTRHPTMQEGITYQQECITYQQVQDEETCKPDQL